MNMNHLLNICAFENKGIIDFHGTENFLGLSKTGEKRKLIHEESNFGHRCFFYVVNAAEEFSMMSI